MLTIAPDAVVAQFDHSGVIHAGSECPLMGDGGAMLTLDAMRTVTDPTCACVPAYLTNRA